MKKRILFLAAVMVMLCAVAVSASAKSKNKKSDASKYKNLTIDGQAFTDGMSVPVGKELTFAFDAVSGADQYELMTAWDKNWQTYRLAEGDTPSLKVVFMTENAKEELMLEAVKREGSSNKILYEQKFNLSFTSDSELTLSSDQASVLVGGSFELTVESDADSVSFYSNTAASSPITGTVLGTVQNDGSNVFHYPLSGIKTSKDDMLFIASDSNGKTSNIVCVTNEYKGVLTPVGTLNVNGTAFDLATYQQKKKVKAGACTIEFDVPETTEKLTYYIKATGSREIAKGEAAGGDHISLQDELSKKDKKLYAVFESSAEGYKTVKESTLIEIN